MAMPPALRSTGLVSILPEPAGMSTSTRKYCVGNPRHHVNLRGWPDPERLGPGPPAVKQLRPLDRKGLNMKPIVELSLAALLVLLAACGRSEPDRVRGGAAAGAATGATIGLVGGPVGVAGGALIGGSAGAIAGATTTPSQVNLGKPVWDK
jgi:hypothetical protein